MYSVLKPRPSTQRMNATNLYVTTTKIILKSDPTNPQSWQDLYRLIPYLRNSLCCVVCSMLLVDPISPTDAQCQHHLCRRCKGGRKKIKPQCGSCKLSTEYKDNKSLRILMQMYQKMCLNLMNSKIFRCIKIQASQPGAGFERGASNLIQLIKEGALYQDHYESQGGLSKSTYSILPCVYTNSCSKSILSLPESPQAESSKSIQSASQSRSSLYSVVYPGSGNKITIKRKPKENIKSNSSCIPVINSMHKVKPKEVSEKAIFKKPCAKPKKGCRCGNATATPGKLTCCGQRCPCYVESKACINCRCRGCRNPHRPDGNKVMPYIPELDSRQIIMPSMRPIQILSQVPTTLVQPTSEILEDEKIEPIHIDNRLFTTDCINSQYKAYKLLSSAYDTVKSLETSDVGSYTFTEDEEENDIIENGPDDLPEDMTEDITEDITEPIIIFTLS